MAKSDAATGVEFVLLAVVAGTLSSSSYQVVSYCKVRAQRRGQTIEGWRDCCLSVANLTVALAGVGFFILASRLGPVSVAMPVNVAASLLVNMIVQYCGGIQEYTRTMVAGTLILAVAALCLMFVGPTDPSESIDVLKLLDTTVAKEWLAFNVLLLLASFAYLMLTRQPQTADAQPEAASTGPASAPVAKSTGARMVAYALFVAESTAMGATIGKMLTVTSGTLLACCFFFYFLMGLGTMFGGLKASYQVDLSVYLPISQCVQLAINGATGLCVWGDAPRVQKPVLYGCVYGVIFLCVFLCSEIDLSKFSRRRQPLADQRELVVPNAR